MSYIVDAEVTIFLHHKRITGLELKTPLCGRAVLRHLEHVGTYTSRQSNVRCRPAR